MNDTKMAASAALPMWQDVKWSAVKEGDIATHKNGNLDARKVVRVDQERGLVWLQILAPTPVGPFPAENYTYQRRTAVNG